MLQAPPPKLATTFSSSDFSVSSDNSSSSSNKQSSSNDAPWELSPRAALALSQVFNKYSSDSNGMSLQDIAVYSQACQSTSTHNVSPEMVSASCSTSDMLKLFTLVLFQDTSGSTTLYILHCTLQHCCHYDSSLAYT
jgi:hypothetical protein